MFTISKVTDCGLMGYVVWAGAFIMQQMGLDVARLCKKEDREGNPVWVSRNGECVSTRRWFFSGSQLTGKVGNES